MSWSFLPELVAEFSEACCSGTEQSARSNTTPTPDQFYWPDKPTEHSRLSRFGMTCEPLMGDRGGELLTWFRAGFHAKTSAQQEQAPESTASEAGYGGTWQGSLARYDRASSSWKTAQCSLLADSDVYSETWPRWGSMRNGALYLRQIAVLRTCENESGYWPTPNTIGFRSDGELLLLSKMASTWAEYLAMSDRACKSKRERFWQTTTVCGNYNRKGASKTSGNGLATVVKTWPTPTATASKGSSPASLVRNSGASREKDRLDHAVMASDGGKLNPEWVEWLMGWPIGHTALKPLEMDRFREFVQQHSLSLPAGLKNN